MKKKPSDVHVDKLIARNIPRLTLLKKNCLNLSRALHVSQCSYLSTPEGELPVTWPNSSCSASWMGWWKEPEILCPEDSTVRTDSAPEASWLRNYHTMKTNCKSNEKQRPKNVAPWEQLPQMLPWDCSFADLRYSLSVEHRMRPHFPIHMSDALQRSPFSLSGRFAMRTAWPLLVRCVKRDTNRELSNSQWKIKKEPVLLLHKTSSPATASLWQVDVLFGNKS